MAEVTPFVYNAVLERVIDGDTIDVMLITEGHAVEYWGGTKTGKILEDGAWGE